MTGITPKCLEKNGKAFIGSNGTLWPCCWIYTLGHELEEWAIKYDCNIDDINLNKYTIDEINNIIKDKIAIYDLTLDKRTQKIGHGRKLENYPLDRLPKFLQDNLNNYREWID